MKIFKIICLFLTVTTHAGVVQDRIATERFYLERYDIVFSKTTDLQKFVEKQKELSSSKLKKLKAYLTALDKVIPSKLLAPLAYYTFFEPSAEARQSVFEILLLNRLLIVRDSIDDPLASETFNQKSTENIFINSKAQIEREAREVRDFTDAEQIKAKLKKSAFMSLALPSAYSLVLQGYISGNQVEVISENDRSESRMNWINENSIFEGGKLDFNLPFMTVQTHPVLQDPIFKRIWQMMDRAQESIFIDIFLFGGTMGSTLSKHLVEVTQLKRKTNPNFRVLLLHDFATNYNMKDEMMPAFEYLRDAINEAEKTGRDSGMILLQANIHRHPPGIPFGITNLIPKTDEVFASIEKKNTYFESKIDHSKVIVIDANTNSAEAYFGSKNWTDHSGAYYYDDAIWIKGPAAALVQASYYDDVDAALTLDEKERKWFFYKSQGFSNDKYLPKKQTILDWFKITFDGYQAQGGESVRLAQANVDGKIKDVRNIFVDMILKAESHIYMEQLFLYDKYIVDALVKRKIQKPTLDIKIIADHNGNFGLNGFPNTMFLNVLMGQGIQVKTRNTFGVKYTFPNGKEREFHQENHRKIVSVDGKVLLGGSSNLNPDTLQGSFREFGAQIFSKTEIARFETNFLTDWSNETLTSLVDLKNIRLKIGKKDLDPAQSAVMNAVGRWIVNSKDILEGKNQR